MRNRKNRGIAKIKENCGNIKTTEIAENAKIKENAKNEDYANTAENVKITEFRKNRKSWKLQKFGNCGKCEKYRNAENTKIVENTKEISSKRLNEKITENGRKRKFCGKPKT